MKTENCHLPMIIFYELCFPFCNLPLKFQCSLENQQQWPSAASHCLWLLSVCSLFTQSALNVKGRWFHHDGPFQVCMDLAFLRCGGFSLFFLQFLKGTLLLLTVFSEIQLEISAFLGFDNGFLITFHSSLLTMAIQSRLIYMENSNKTKYVFQEFHLSAIFKLS